jgi:hypothetical protein
MTYPEPNRCEGSETTSGGRIMSETPSGATCASYPLLLLRERVNRSRLGGGNVLRPGPIIRSPLTGFALRLRSQLNDALQRYAWAKSYRLLQLIHHRLATAHVVEARFVGLAVGDELNL